MQSQRWGWTYTYGMPLLIASIAAVLLSGGGLVAAVLAFGGEEPTDPTPPGTTPAVPSAGPTEAASPPPGPGGDEGAAGDPGCVLGSWRAVDLKEGLITGELVLVDGGPVFTYRDDGTGAIEFGEGVTFEFYPLFGTSTVQDVSGTVEFSYVVQDGDVVHTYLNPLDGATMHFPDLGDFPYVPSSDTLSYECGDGTLRLTAEDAFQADLERIS
ncbi:MAG TPA: hypothetical protein VKZ74_05865 [Natronosporangium sp.]|nr:hypothetical protein [Natronosporangium sp.]